MKWKFRLPWTKDNKEDLVRKKNYEGDIVMPGRVSVPNDTNSTELLLNQYGEFVTASYRQDLIPLIRKLYKVNPDMGIALQDMYKLANSGHIIEFPDNTEEEAKVMRDHLKEVTKKWFPHTAGANGAVNKFIVQALISGAMSYEKVPNKDLSGISHIIWVKPEDIIFKRDNQGMYEAYQKNISWKGKKETYIRLNPATYKYLGMFNDLDEPYGVPPFMTALDSLVGQADMKVNFKHLMEIMGLLGFLEVTIEKPDPRNDESDKSYERRLNRNLVETKKNMYNGIKDGLVIGYIGDHEFKMNATTKDLGNVDKLWNLNQQSVANGLGVAGSLIGVSSDNKTEGGTSIMFSKLISQLKNLQMFAKEAMEDIYNFELFLGSFNNKGCRVKFNTSTITDDVKVQQGLEYKIRNLRALYNQGVINNERIAFEMGYEKSDLDEPRLMMGDNNTAVKDEERETDKDTSDRKTRDKNKTNPKRKDGETKER